MVDARAISDFEYYRCLLTSDCSIEYTVSASWTSTLDGLPVRWIGSFRANI